LLLWAQLISSPLGLASSICRRKLHGGKDLTSLKIRIKNELLLIDILSLLLIGTILVTPFRIARIILGLALVLLFPGYMLIAALFPKGSDLDPIERVALSFALSIALVPLMGFILNFTRWGIRLYPILILLTAFMIVMSMIAWIRRARILPSEEFNIILNINFPSWAKESKLGKALTIALISSIVMAVGSLIYVISTPKSGEKFTEFYILAKKGTAEGYPRKLWVGETEHLILGIENHEYRQTTYTAKMLMGEKEVRRIGPIILKNKEKWEKKISFTPTQPGKKIRVEFLLYKNSHNDPYRSLHLWIDVIKKAPAPLENK